MKTRNLIFTALTALTLSVLAGCSSETELPQEAPDVIPEGMARIEFAIKGVKTGSSYAASPTVGLEPVERQINDVTAYLFKMAGGQSVIADGDPVDEVVATTVADGKASFLMPVAALEGDRYAVVLIGNKVCFNATALASVVKGSTYATLNAVETRENTAIMGNLLNGGLPMRALTAITIPAGGGKVTVDAKFSRPLSRFDIDNRALHSFKITSVVLANGRKTSPLNMAGTANMVAGTPADVTYSTFISDVNERLTPPDLNPDGSNSKLRPAFYTSPALAADDASLLVKGTLRSGLSEFPAEYVVPLVNKTTSAKIVIGMNKRYRVTLTMDKDDNIIGDVSLDLGEWEDNDLNNPDMKPDLSYQVGGINPATVTYDPATRTFSVASGMTSFRFEMINDLGVNPAYAGDGSTIVTSVKRVSNINSRVVKLVSYEVALKGSAGTGSFLFTTKDAKVYTFNVVAVTPPTIAYPGFTEPAVLVGDVYWAPVNIGATTVDEPGKLYQYGRMTGWTSAQEMVDSKANDDWYSKITFTESETTYAGKALLNNGGIHWWGGSSDKSLQTMLANWVAVSNGTNNPCPSGWRLPTHAQMIEIEKLAAAPSVFVEVSPGVTKTTVGGVSFIRKEWLSNPHLGTPVVRSGTSSYFSVHNSDLNTFTNLLITDSDYIYATGTMPGEGGGEGGYIRCVKDK